MTGSVQCNPVCGWEGFTSSEDRTQSARSVGQRLTHRATRAPRFFGSKEYTRETETADSVQLSLFMTSGNAPSNRLSEAEHNFQNTLEWTQRSQRT